MSNMFKSDNKFGISDAMLEAVKNIINPKSNKSIDGEESGSEEEKDEKPKINRMKKAEHMKETLIGNQHKIDANHNGKIDAQDFKILKGKKKTNEEVELGEDTFTKQYRNNEDDNKHSENVVLLAKHFGSKTDHEKAKDILQQHMKIGHLPDNLRDEREKIHKKLWPKARAHMMHQEEVEFSEAEIARIEAIAKSI